MSLKMTTLAWKTDIPHNEKYVLLALAECHNDRTNQCNPGTGSIMKMTGLSKRQILRLIKALETRNLITTKRASRTSKNEYIFRLPEVTPTTPRRGDTHDTSRGDTDGTSRGDICDMPEVTSTTLREVTSTTPPNKEEPRYTEPELEPYAPAGAGVGAGARVRDADKKAPKKSTPKPSHPESVVKLAERFAACRAKYAGMKRVTPESVDYYAGLIAVIFDRGEIGEAELGTIATWFESTDDGAKSWEFGLGKIARTYDHVLIKNYATYLARAQRTSGADAYRARVMTAPTNSTPLTPEQLAEIERETEEITF